MHKWGLVGEYVLYKLKIPPVGLRVLILIMTQPIGQKKFMTVRNGHISQGGEADYI